MTEKSGRVHTSAVSVVILPQADQVQIHPIFNVMLPLVTEVLEKHIKNDSLFNH